MTGSETVINREGAPGLVIPPDADAPSGQMIQRLFPPTQETGSSVGSFSPRGIELDHFRIEERIGMGGMGAVFRAVDTRLQRHVALKLLAPSQSYDEGAVKRFQNEARAAARLDHEHVARVYYIGAERGLHFIAFEFVTGSTIREMIRQNGRIPISDSINYALQIATALKHTSAMGVVHRDIKPSNIIITPNGRAKLVDLGLARNDTTESQVDLTLPGTTLGTFDYISPEQAKDPRSVDIRSDIYSLGCTLYHMLTGQPPYPEGTVLQKLLDHQGGEAPDPAAINRRVPDFLSAIARRMMNSDRNRRYQNADQLIRDLTHAAGIVGLRGVNPEGLVWVASKAVEPGRLARHAGWMSTVALLLAVAGALQVYNNWERRLPEAGTRLSGTAEVGETTSQAGSGSEDAGRESESAESSPGESSPDAAASSGAPAKISGEPRTGLSPGPPGDSIQTEDAQPSVKEPEALASLESSSGPPLVNVGSVLSTDEAPIPRMAELFPEKPASSGDDTSSTTAADPTAEPKETAPDKPEDSDASPQTVPVPEPQLPVALFTGDASLDRHYRTLEAACAAAGDGSTIELQFTGRLVEKSFRIMKKNLTIRAARDHHPVIEFVPSEIDSTDADARMLSVQGGPLHLVNVGLQMTVPDRPTANRYALFGLSGPGALKMDSVSVTVDNPSQAPASIIDISGDAGRMPADMPNGPVTTQREELDVQATDCLFRGHSQFARIAWPGQLNFSIENCAAALRGDFFRIRPLITPSGSRPVLNLNLEHVTARLDGSFMQLVGPVSVDAPSIECKVRNSIFSLSDGSPVIVSGPGIMPEDARRILSWHGQRNLFDETSVFWSIESSGDAMNWDQWRELWETDGSVGEINEPVDWIVDPLPLAPDKLDELTPEAFSLAPGLIELNPAIQAATDGSDAGVDVFSLPPMSETEQPGRNRRTGDETTSPRRASESAEPSDSTPERTGDSTSGRDASSGSDSTPVSDPESGGNGTAGRDSSTRNVTSTSSGTGDGEDESSTEPPVAAPPSASAPAPRGSMPE